MSNEVEASEGKEFFDALAHEDAATRSKEEGKEEEEPGNDKLKSNYSSWHCDAVALYICLFATFGEICRVYIGRLFGSDCGKKDEAPADFLAPWFRHICVTNSGTTDQTGGALFLDLPANMLGCFLMGLITHPSSKHSIPWFHPHHPIQQHKAFLNGLRTGFCGSLTTFASWNTQMVQMLDGTGTVLGPQVVAALSGYVLGVGGPVSFFLLGRFCHECWATLHQRAVEREDAIISGEEKDTDNDDLDDLIWELRPRQGDSLWWQWFVSSWFNVYMGPVLLLSAFYALFLVGGIAEDIQFYQELVVGTAMAPVGALVRWKLSSWNDQKLEVQKQGRRWWRRLKKWVPWGTLVANLVASMIAAGIQAVEVRYLADFDDPWTSELLPAVKVGFAGSLSTVSTMIKEMFALPRPFRPLLYVLVSVTLGMLLGLLVFSPIAR